MSANVFRSAGLPYSGFQAPLVKNTVVSDSILTTISDGGKPWTTLLWEGRFGIASRPFG